LLADNPNRDWMTSIVFVKDGTRVATGAIRTAKHQEEVRPLSTRNKILIGALVLVVASVLFQYIIPSPLQVKQPHVSVKAEPVFHIGASGIGLGPEEGAYVVNNSMILSAIVVLVMIILAFLATRNMKLVPSGLQNFMEMVIDGLYNTFGAVDRKYISRFFPLVGTVFFYVLLSNWLALIPGVLSVGYYLPYSELEGGDHSAFVNRLAYAGEAAPLAEEDELVLVPWLRSPSADLNNTFMLAIVAFFYVQFWGIKELGGSYFYKFLPYREGPIGIFTGLVEIISEFARVVSFAFRLFGNVFAGEVILLVMVFLLPALQLPFMGLEVFIGFIQAFVFAILIMVFASLATQSHGDHGGEHGHHGEPVPADLGGSTRANPAH
jgi:F-type H+-transporting ATPase subunit a